MRHRTVYLLLLFIINTISNGQPLEGLININTEHGLPSLETYGMIQDSKGYLWICSNKGVTKYDGTHMKTYTTESGLSDNTVFNAKEDKKGRIWFRSYNSISWHRNDTVFSPQCNDTLRKLFPSRIISGIHFDGDTVWLTLYGYGHFVKIIPPGFDKIAIIKNEDCDGTIKSLPSGDMLCALFTKKESNFKLRTIFGKRIKEINLPIEFSLFAYVLTINDSNFIISPGANEIFHYNKGHLRKQSLANRVIGITKDVDGYWVSVFKDGIYKYELNSTKPIYHLLNGHSTYITYDYEGGAWFPTLENGLYYKRNLNNNLYSYKEYSSSSLNRFLNKVNGKLFIGTDNPRLIAIDSTLNYKIIDLGVNMKGYNINDIEYYNENYFLSGFGSLKMFDQKFRCTKKFLLYKFDTTETSVYRNVRFYNGKEMLVSDGYSIYRLKTPELKGVRKIIFQSRINNFIYDTLQHVILAATKDGLYKIGADFRIQSHDFKGQVIKQLYVTKEGKVYFSSQQSGLYCINNGMLERVFYKEGVLFSGFDFDKSDNIWIGSDKGLFFLERSGNNYHASSLNKSDGLRSDDVNQVVCYRDFVWYTTNNSLYYFNPDKMLASPVSPKFEIDKFLVNGRSYPYGKAVTLKYTENNIEIDANCLSYLPGQPGEIVHRLIGHDSVWRKSNGAINYSSLDPGKYHLEIKAVNAKGIYSSDTKRMNFTILPPFWKTWWFILFEVLLYALFVLTMVWWYIKRVRTQEKEKAGINAQLNEYQMTALRAQINPHFIFNCISAIQTLVLREKIDESYQYLQKFAKLLRLVLENSKRNFLNLREELEVNELYIQLEQLRFKDSFVYIKKVDPSILMEDIKVPYMILQPLIENAIWHGLLHSENAHKQLLINVKKGVSENTIVIEIEDNGIGREKSMEYASESKKSMGLNITTGRMGLMDQEYNSKTSFEVIDLYAGGKPAGTKVQLTIPLK